MKILLECGDCLEPLLNPILYNGWISYLFSKVDTLGISSYLGGSFVYFPGAPRRHPEMVFLNASPDVLHKQTGNINIIFWSYITNEQHSMYY